MSQTMTIFCHGTRQYSDELSADGTKGLEEAELVTDLEANYRLSASDAAGSFNGGKLLLQGVGSEENPIRMSWPEMGGWISQRDTNNAAGSGMQRVRNLLNQMSGSGTSSNIAFATSILLAMARDGRRPTAINMVGWSRGGVACVRLAESLSRHQELSGIPVNIFAADPVPGGPRSSSMTLPSQVCRYLQIYALDVTGLKSAVFRGLQVRKSAQNSRCVVLPMPGNHSQVVKAHLPSVRGTLAANPGAITKHLAYYFLLAAGSYGVVEGTPTLAPRGCFDAYETILTSITEKSGAYPATEQAMSGGFSNRGSWPHLSSNRTSNIPQLANTEIMGDIYVNEHHAYLKRHYNPQCGRPNLSEDTVSLFNEMFL